MVRPAIVDLYNKSRTGKAVQALLGATHPISGGQIAYGSKPIRYLSKRST